MVRCFHRASHLSISNVSFCISISLYLYLYLYPKLTNFSFCKQKEHLTANYSSARPNTDISLQFSPSPIHIAIAIHRPRLSVSRVQLHSHPFTPRQLTARLTCPGGGPDRPDLCTGAPAAAPAAMSPVTSRPDWPIAGAATGGSRQSADCRQRTRPDPTPRTGSGRDGGGENVVIQIW